MISLLLAVPIVLPIALALFGIGPRSFYIALSVASFLLAIFIGLLGREVKSEVLFAVWILMVAAFLGCGVASLVHRRRSAAS